MKVAEIILLSWRANLFSFSLGLLKLLQTWLYMGFSTPLQLCLMHLDGKRLCGVHSVWQFH